MTDDTSERSMAPLNDDHLARLSAIAHADHEKFFLTRPEYRGRCLAIVLAQGAALHWVYCKSGVKDLDVWSFFSLPPGTSTFPAPIRNVHVDFGPSELGRQHYNLASAKSDAERRRLQKWSRFSGRRVDLLMRGLPDGPEADPVEAIRSWLRPGATAPRTSPQFLAKKPIILIDPEPLRGEVVWPPEMKGSSRTSARLKRPHGT